MAAVSDSIVRIQLRPFWVDRTPTAAATSIEALIPFPHIDLYGAKFDCWGGEAAIDAQRDQLLQVLMVNAAACVEVERLQLIAGRQEDLRSALYRGLVFGGSDSVGVPDMRVQTYPDAASLFRHLSCPSFSITVACRPGCAALLRTNPSSVTNTFILELERMMGDIIERRPFGTIVAAVRAVQFRPLALPRAHIILFVPRSPSLQQPCTTLGDLSAGIGSLALDFEPALRPSPLYMAPELLDRVPASTPASCISLCPPSVRPSSLRHPPALPRLQGAPGAVVPHSPTKIWGSASRSNYGFKSYPRRNNMTARCGNFSFKAARASHSLGHIDELVVEPTDLPNCEAVCPRWKRLINNDSQFLALHPCRGGDWTNWLPSTIKDFVNSDKEEGACRAIVLTLCKTTVEVRCSHVLDSYPQNYFANQDELIYIRKRKRICLRCGERTSQQLHITARCHVLLYDGSATWRKTLREDVIEQLLRTSLLGVLAVDDAFIANNVRRRHSEALDHSAILRSRLEGMEALFKIEYDGPGEPVDYDFLIVTSGHPIHLRTPCISTNSQEDEPACVGKSWIVVNDF